MSHWLIVPVEIKMRELDAKLLLASAACARGFRVILGERYAVQRRISRVPEGIYLGKDVTRSVEGLYRAIRGLGHRVVALDEEALVYYSRDIYRTRRCHPRTVASLSALLAWGPDNAEMWSESPGGSGVPAIATGNPRFDLLRKELRHLHEEAVEELRRRFGRFILMNTNFGHVNHFVPKFTKMPDPGRLEAALQARGGKAPHFYDPELSRHRNRIYDAFKEMVPRLARAFPERRLVLRPHPSEDMETWRELLSGTDNAEAVREGPAVPWILAADVLVHNGCTTAIEARLAGTPAVAYRPLRDEAREPMLPNALSHEVETFEELLKAVEAALSRSLGEPPERQREKEALVQRFLSGREGAFAAERIASVLEELPPASPRRAIESLRSRCVLGWQGAKRARKERRESGNRRAWRELTFPPTSLAEVRDRLRRLSGPIAGSAGLEVSELAPNLFRIERSSS